MKMIAKIFGQEPNREKDMPDRLSFLQTITPALAAFPEPATRSVVIVVEKDHFIGPDLRWPLRMARPGEGNITVLFGMKNIENTKEIDLSATAGQPDYEQRIAERMRSTLDDYLGPGQWANELSEGDSEVPDDGPNSQNRKPLVRLRLMAAQLLVEEIKRLTPNPRWDLVLFIGSADDDQESREAWLNRVKQTLRACACSLGVVIPGTRQDDGEVLVAADRGPHGRNAIDLAATLAADTDRRITGLYVEPDIGPDAPDVGRRILDRLISSALEDKKSAQVERRVVIHNDPAKGIVRSCREGAFELLVLGVTRLGALGEVQSNSVPNRVLRLKPEATLVAVRNTVPLRNRIQRWIFSQIQRHVPQLVRADRIELVERIQSNAHWNFDFILLMGLSTIIATLGLLDNSPAVIIGAMLVAPLMTPLIGLGLSITQGNVRLARMTLKAVLLGFVTAFGLAFAIGLLSGEFHEASAEMSARDWPQFRDLVVAFISGLAAAYASARPSLLAALPGVAIAAALLPPVATAGLAMSIGNLDLAFGALLLFVVNMVAIIVSAAISLWAVGIRHIGKVQRMTRLLGIAFIIAVFAMALVLTFAPPRLAPPRELTEAVESALADEFRLRRIRLHREPGAIRVLQVDVGGTRLPDTLLRQKLDEIVNAHLGKKTGVRLTFRYETFVK